MPHNVLAVDIGGTKLAAGVVTSSGSIISSARTPTPQIADPEAVYAALLQSVHTALDSAGGASAPAAIGIGCGGPMRMWDGVVSPLNIPGWREFPLPARLSADFNLPAVLDNDAKAFALGEHMFGSGRGHDNMMGVVVSTGVGGGIISAGRLLHGRTGNAGHVGHVPVEPGGPPCACGGQGCVEAIASGPSLARLASTEIRAGTPSRLSALLSEGPLTGRDVAEAAQEGDALALALFERAGRALGAGFAAAAALADLDLIVLGGGISSVGELLLRPVRESVARYAGLDYIRGLEVVPASTGPEAGLVGAAALVLAESV